LISKGVLRDISVEQVEDVVGNLIYGTMFTNFFVGRKKSFEQQVQDILDIVFRGILTERGRFQFLLNSTSVGTTV